MKRSIALFFCCMLFISAFAFAQQPVDNPDPASREQITRMMEVLQVRKQVDSVMNTMQGQMSSMMEQQFKKMAPDAPPAMVAEMSAAMSDMMKDMQPMMAGMIDQMVPVYQKYLSRTDVDAITNFYMSPEGQSFLSKMPLITAEAMPLVIKSTTDQMQPMMDKMSRRMEEIVKKYKPKAAAPAPEKKTGTKKAPAASQVPAAK